jgi:hypothetical protein
LQAQRGYRRRPSPEAVTQSVLWHHDCREHSGAVQEQDRHHHPVH